MKSASLHFWLLSSRGARRLDIHSIVGDFGQRFVRRQLFVERLPKHRGRASS